MPRLTIDEQSIEVPDGTTVLQAAEKLGIFVPHYCYHGGLSISGNCRMCLVEVEKFPKLTTACTQPVAEGMVVRTTTEKVKRAQADVLEFLLKNHPLDCPICDQAGECLLQDFYMEYDRKDSRLHETKNRKAKGKSIGPRIVLDQERCILCTRCVRFLNEVTHTSELGVFGRGSREVLDIFPGVEVDNEYDVNIVDLCPVGALTDKDFRFRVRSWYLDTKPSVCDSCSTGCSILVDYNVRRTYQSLGRRIIRYRPRHNPDVNGWWMCNHGRRSYKKHEENRLLVAEVRPESGFPDRLTGILARLCDALREEMKAGQGREIGVIVAPSVSNEEAAVIAALFRDGIGTPNIDYRIPGLVHGASPQQETTDGILRRPDPWPNSRGLELLGLAPGENGLDVKGMIGAAARNELSLLVVIGADLTESSLDPSMVRDALGQATSIAFVTHRGGMSHVAGAVVPVATHLERLGTYTNYRGVVQKFNPVVDPPGEARPLLAVLAEIGRGIGVDVPEPDPEAIFRSLAERMDAFQGLTYEVLTARERVTIARSQWVNSMIVPQL